MTPRSNPKGRRAGVTLIELLIVSLVVLIVSALGMTAAAPALKSRGLREGARILEVMINRGRNRALQTGRAAGIWIDREPGLPEGAATISLCEVPDIYGGDFPNSGVSAIREPFIGTEGTRPGPQEYLLIVEPHLIPGPIPSSPGDNASTANLKFQNIMNGLRNVEHWGSADPAIQQVVRPGDQIQFNFIGPRFVLQSSDTCRLSIPGDVRNRYGGSPKFFYGKVMPAQDSGGNYTFNANGFYNYGAKHNGAPEVDGHVYFANASRNLPTEDVVYSSVPARYRLFRQPVKSAGGAVSMPEGTIIDLNYSGSRKLSFNPRLDPSYNDPTSTIYDLRGRPPSPFSGISWNVQAGEYMAPPQFPEDDSPIVIVFSAEGTVDRVYTRFWNPWVVRGSVKGSWEWSVDRVFEPIHFLIGKRQKLPTPTAFSGHPDKANWCDPEALWVSIIPNSGFIGVSENALVPYDLMLFGLRGGEDINRPNDAFYSMTPDPTIRLRTNGLDHMGYGARRIANMLQVMGGR